jgi:hypothetical protein
MEILPNDATDRDLIDCADRWAALLEAESYDEAFALTAHDPRQGWSAELVRRAIKSYGDATEDQRVTLLGQPTDITQRKDVDRWFVPGRDSTGEVWYDLNIDGLVSDLTATFDIVPVDSGLVLRLRDIHVM